MSELRDVDLASPSEKETHDPIGRKVISVIGIDRYRHWGQLANADRDARGAALLFSRLGFEEVVAPLLNERATRRAIEALVTDQLVTLGSDDSLVLFYAGHGGTRKRQLGGEVVKTGYLIPVDGSEEVATWIELEGWLRAVSLLPAKHILVILDACHSGIALGPIVKWRDIGSWQGTPLSTLNARRSRRIITSALDDQLARDSGPVYGHSLFTGCLIEGLTGGIARDGREAITGSELGLYVQRRVETYPQSRQTPDFGTFDFDDRGEMAIPFALDQPKSTAEPAPPVRAPRALDPSERTRKPRWASIASVAAVAGILAVVGIVVLVRARGDRSKREVSQPAPADVPPVDAFTASQEPEMSANRWVRIDPPPEPYRLGVADKAPAAHVGFRASRGILTPSLPYAIQEHEVAWSELDPWLAANGARVDYPRWATDARVRARLPATSITWEIASAYCHSLGGALPTEEQWEYAARGPERRPNPWGVDPLDRQMTHVFAAPDAAPSPVMESRQDRTPHTPHVYDLAGNVQEWTLGLWREAMPGREESDAQAGKTTSRTIRGLPLAGLAPATIQPDSSAYRERLCATGPCVERTRALLERVGFRCAKALDR